MERRIDNSWLTATVVGLLALLLVAPPAALAKAHPGQLDTKFGGQGRVLVPFPAENPGTAGVKYEVPFQFTPGHVQMALAPGGKIVIAGSTQLVRLLANGKLDRSFGTNGIVKIERPAGQSFVLADLAVDSKGRVLLAGSARPQPSASTPDPLISSAMVRRYAADGSVDPSFGNQGTVITDFGIKPPKIGPGFYKAPSVGLRSMVVDSQGRPVLTGGSVTEIVNCGFKMEAVNTGFVARLTASGAPDPGFGEGGLRQITDVSSFAQGHLLPGGNLFAIGSPKVACGATSGPPVLLTGFDGSGNLASGFGFAGFRSVGFRTAPVANLAPSGKILLLGPAQKSKHATHQLVMRLLPDGAIDPGFSRTGRVKLMTPRRSSFDAIAADQRERVLLAGRISRRLHRGNGPRRSTFMLARFGPTGKFDRSFGDHGSVTTGFGGPSDSYATQVMAGKRGRILVGGLISTPLLPTGGGYAIARYLGGP
jgi:uncharacterized delta-60 repeat protein